MGPSLTIESPWRRCWAGQPPDWVLIDSTHGAVLRPVAVVVVLPTARPRSGSVGRSNVAAARRPAPQGDPLRSRVGLSSLLTVGDVFVLGAGFSRAVSPEMPTTNLLADAIAERLALDPRFSHWVIDGQLPDADVERWLSRLAERHPFDDSVTFQYHQATFAAVSRAIAAAIRVAQARAVSGGGPPAWLAALVRAWDQARSTVITFNYDTLVEATYSAMQELGSIMDSVMLPPGGVSSYVPLYGAPGSAQSFALCKLHGSTSWYWHPEGFNRGVVDVGIEERWPGSASAAEHPPLAERVGAREPFIVPPTSLKGPFFQHDTLRHHWNHAYKQLREADRVWIVGYSLPLTDMVAGALLAPVADKGTQLTVVNRDPTPVLERLHNVVPNVEIEMVDGYTAVETFATSYTSAQLSAPAPDEEGAGR